jgi:probable H4MPT-linked C1 transfer pathway protein
VSQPPAILGWDIGGVNTKASRLGAGAGTAASTLSLAFELQRDRTRLGPTLQSIAARLRSSGAEQHAVTMTAELSQVFRTKREGVGFIVQTLEDAFPASRLHLYTVTGKFVSPRDARSDPLQVAASNWAATAGWVARHFPDCVFADIGTTTTDLIPITGGAVAARGRTDPDRLSTGELIYTGALRTPVEAFARRVPLGSGTAAVSAEGFALSGDLYLWLRRLEESDYSCPTPDGRPATREYAGERLARVVCADREILDDRAIDQIAEALAEAQLEPIIEALGEIRSCYPIRTAVVTGLGEFIAAEAARRAGLEVVRLSDRLPGAGQTAAATSVAWLLRETLSEGR